MNIIQLRMIQIPKHIKTALKVLGGKLPASVIKSLLPKLLNNIKATGDECVTLTNTTKNEFHKVMNLIQEVKVTVTASQSAHEIKVEENEREMVILRQQKEKLEKEEQIRGQHYREAVAAANRAEQIYYDALRQIPVGWNAVKQDLVRTGGRILEKLAEAGAAYLTGNYGRSGGAMSQGYYGAGSGSDSEDGSQEPPSFALRETVDTAEVFSNALRSFQEAFSSDERDPKQLSVFSIPFKAHREYISSLSSNSAKSKVIRLIERGERIVKKAFANAKRSRSSDKIDEEIRAELEKIFSELEPIQTVHQQVNARAASNAVSNVGKGDHGPADSSRNEVLKAQVAQRTLTEMRRRQDEQTREYLKLIDTLHQASAKMMSIDLSTANYREIIVLLNESFALLSQIHEQWNDFVLFFKQMAIHIDNMVKGPLKRFLDVASEGSNINHAARMELIYTLKDETLYSVHVEAYILYVMARTYYEMSSKYFMNRLAGLSSMLITRDDTQRNATMHTLRNQTDQALEEIKAVILQRKENFNKEFESRYAEISQLIETLGGPNENIARITEEANNLIESDKVWGDR